MKKLLLPLILALIGIAGGVGAGIALRPAKQPETMPNPCGETDHSEKTDAGDHAESDGHDDHESPDEQDYVKLNNQFIVPVVKGDAVNSLVVMSLSIEIAQGQRELVYAREPKLRDALLQVMFDHANMGGFEGAFTDGNTLDVLRVALTETAQSILGNSVNSVLIVEIARQDM